MEESKKKEVESKEIVKHPLIDWVGWKKDSKKIILVLVALVIVFGIVKGAMFWSNTHLLGLRMHLAVSRVQYSPYSHIGPNFNFKFPDYFVADSDEQKKYGDSYLGGFRLKGDQRTGCDVRSNPVGINFQKSDKEIHDAVIGDLSAHIKDLQEVSAVRQTIGGENAYVVGFTFTDPLNNRTRISQVITSHAGNNYVFVCGTGDYQYSFFADDFSDFLKSFSWTN
jgi:hypothetical protein